MKKVIITLLFSFFCFHNSQAYQQNFIEEWLVLGTFPNNDTETLLSFEYMKNDKNVTPSSGDYYAGKEWRFEKIIESGNLNFNRMPFDVDEYCGVYAHVYVHSEEERNVILHIGSDDGVMLYVNGKLVHYNMAWRGWAPDQDRVVARVGKGWNRFMFKVFNGGGGFDLSARVTDANDVPIPSIRYSAENPYRNQIFPTPEVEPWVIVDKVELASVLEKDGKNFTYPINLFMKNIGTKDVTDLKVNLVAKSNTGENVVNKDYRINLTDAGPTKIALSEKDIISLLESEASLDVEIDWKDRKEKNAINLDHIEFLRAILATRNKGVPPSVSEKLAYLEPNLRWAMFFMENDFSIDKSSITSLSNKFFREDWKNVENDLDELISKVKSISPRLKENTIYFTGNSHIDMAWLWKFEETVQVVYETFESALNFSDKYDQFIYAQSSAQAYWWMENRFPALFKRIQEKVKNGQWEIVGGMWVEPDLNMPSGESIARQLLYGKRYFLEKFGVDVKVGYNPDSFGYNLMLPQIYKRAGLDYFITQKIGWNDTNVFPHRTFWWESPDGSRLLTFFPHTYVHTADHRLTASQFKDFKKSSGGSDQLVLYGVGNHGGGPTQMNIDRIQEMKELDAFPKVKESSTLDFMHILEKEETHYPVWRDELYLEYHRGVLTSQANMKKSNRINEILLEEAEKFSVMSGINYPEDEIKEGWRLTLFNQFHDILPGSSIPEVFDDAEVQHAFVKSLGNRTINRALDSIVGSIDYASEGIPIVVFNPLSWERTELTGIEPPDNYQESMGLYDASGKEVPYELIDGEITFTAQNIPSIGYATYYLRAGRYADISEALKVTETSLENEFLKVVIDPATGNISSIFDKPNNREVLESGKQGNVLEIFEDKPSQWDAWNIGYTGKEWRIEDVKKITIKDDTKSKVSLRVIRTFGDSEFTQDLILKKGSPSLDIDNTVNWNEKQKLLKAAFNLAVKNDMATYEIPYGTIERATVPRNSFDRAKFEVNGHKWIDLSDRSGEYGVSLLNDSKYGFDIKDSKMRITLLKAPNWPDPDADIGTHKFTYSLYPHKGDWKEALSYRKGYALNYPLLVRTGRKGPAKFPESMSFVKTDNPGIMISVVKKAEDSSDIVLRFYEVQGKNIQAKFTFDKEIVRVKETDLIERPEKDIPFTKNEVVVDTKPYEIKTLLIKFYDSNRQSKR